MSSLAETFAAARRHHQDGQLAQAEVLCRRILDAAPDHAGALHLLGVLAHQQGRHDQAIELLGRAVALDPTRPAYHNNLGVALRAAGRLAEAADAYRAAARLAPASADAHANLGVALHELGRSDEARARYEEALRLRPDHVDALFNLANLLHQRGHSEQALPLYHRAQVLAPSRADILNNLGNALLAHEQVDKAIAAYRAALSLNPDHAEAWANLGTALGQQDRIAEAAEAFAAAARLRPQDEHWTIRSAALCPAVFPSSEALDAYRKGLEAVLDTHPAGVRLRPEDAASSGCHPPFNLAHHGRNDRDLKARFAAAFLANFPARHASVSTAGMPRVGFVATDPRRGMFLRCTAGIIDHLDPGQFDVVVFGPERGGDALRAAIARPDARIVTIPDRLPGAAECIAAERCDVLYHWQIGSDALNYFLPFTRPAPIQCTSWGTHVTSGVPAVDYYLSSALIEPPGAEAHYTETLVRFSTLPTYQRPIRRPDPPARRSEFGLPEGVPLYACLQRLQKFHPDFDPLLVGLLRRDRCGLVVALRDRHGHAAAQLAARFRATIPDVADRIVFLPRQDRAGYLRLLSLADAVLDTPHYGAGATAYDILGLARPLVTLPGALHIGRYALGCYRKMGVLDLVASSPDHYIELAARLGRDRAYREEIAVQIAATSPVLFEDREAVREHERFFARAVAVARADAAPSP